MDSMEHLTGTILSAEEVGLKYAVGSDSERPALAELTLDVFEHECCCILGPSGCGKTSLLNLFSGFILPTFGRVSFRSSPIKESQVSCGRIFQHSTLFPWRTVAANIGCGSRMSNLSKGVRELETKSLLEQLQLPDCGDLYPYQLSGGMLRRAEIARTIANEPDVLLADEPFSNLDYQTARQVRQWFSETIERLRLSVVFVTHDIEEAVFLGDRVAVMTPAPGRIARIIDVPFPHPRSRTLLRSGEFTSIVAKVEDLLMECGAA